MRATHAKEKEQEKARKTSSWLAGDDLFAVLRLSYPDRAVGVGVAPGELLQILRTHLTTGHKGSETRALLIVNADGLSKAGGKHPKTKAGKKRPKTPDGSHWFVLAVAFEGGDGDGNEGAPKSQSDGDDGAPKSLHLQATRSHSLAALPEHLLKLVLSFLPSAWNRWRALTSDDEVKLTGYRSPSRRCGAAFQRKHQQPAHTDALPGEYGSTFDVFAHSLQSLQPGNWLKGEVIDKFLSLLCTRNLQGQLLLFIRQRCRHRTAGYPGSSRRVWDSSEPDTEASKLTELVVRVGICTCRKMVDQLDKAADPDPDAPHTDQYMDQLLLLLGAEERRRAMMARIHTALPPHFRPVNRAWDDLVALVARRVESEVGALVVALENGGGGENPCEYLLTALRHASSLPHFLDAGNNFETNPDGSCGMTNYQRACLGVSSRDQWQDWNAWEAEGDYHSAGHPYALCPMHFMSSHFFTELRRGGNAGVVAGRWTRGWRFFDQHLVVIPINWEDMHWAICFVFPKLKRVRYYDSMGRGLGPQEREVERVLMTYMVAEAVRAGSPALCTETEVREAQLNALTHSTDSICYCALHPFPQFPEPVVV